MGAAHTDSKQVHLSGTFTKQGGAMGLLDGVLGNASKIDASTVHQEFHQILAPGERVEHAYQLIRDYFVFTNKRFVLVDRQGLTGSKVEYHSIPYKSITHFSIETAGTFDLDAELKIWISGSPTPIQKQFNNRLNIYEVQAVLAAYILGADSQTPSRGTSENRSKTAVPPKAIPPAGQASTESDSSGNSDLEFCFHCGEAVASSARSCRSCGGSLA
jgi:hypothetical protein